MPRPHRFLTLGLTAGAALALTAPAANAGGSLYTPTGHECRLAPLVPGLIAGAALVDPLGYVYDTTEVSLAYGALDDASTQLSKVGVLSADAYDRFGALFVGDGQSEATRYRDPAAEATGCAAELDGRQLALKDVELDGLAVQRRLFVSATAGSGARLLDTLRNDTSAPITTDVYVGDLRVDSGGSLGSDWTTTVNATSDGDTDLEPADRWAVTTDGRPIASDPAIAHVWGGAGAADDVDVIRSGATHDDAIDQASPLDADQLGWGWTDVTVAPGETRSYLSWEAIRAALDTKASTQAGLASTAAADIVGAQLSRVYEGLTAAQIGSVANWAKPTASAAISAGSATAGEDVTFTASNVNFGSTAVAACTTGSLSWDFGDGGTATGRVVTHRFGAGGSTEVALTVSGTCGGTSVARKTISVAPPKVVEQPVVQQVKDPEPAPAVPADQAATPAAPVPADGGEESAAREATSDPAAAALTLNVAPKLTATELGKRGVRPTLLATAPGTVRLVLSGGGLKIVKTKQVAAGTETPAAMKLGPGDAKRVKGLKTLQLRAKLTLATGGEVVVSRVITVGR